MGFEGRPERLEKGGSAATVETEVHKEDKLKGPFLGWFVGLVVPVQEIFCSTMAALVGPVQKMFFLTTIHYFKSFAPSPSKLGTRQPCWAVFLLVCVSGGDL
jgi:hypothetical protein